MKPLLIHPAHLAQYMQFAGMLAGPQKGDAVSFSAPGRQAGMWDGEKSASEVYQEERAGTFIAPYLYDLGGGVAEIRLEGGVYQLTTMQERWYADYVICNRLAQQSIRHATENPDVKAVRVVINSPGGTVVGTPETARALALLTESKNGMVIGCVDNMACSAAQWMLAGCGMTYASPSADVGSIGVYSVHLDYGKTYAAYFETDFNLIRDGERKAEFYREMTDEMRAEWQASVSEIGTSFRDSIRTMRGRDIPEAAMQGQSLTGVEGLAAGLVDALSDDPQGAALLDLREMISRNGN